jgi:hypothetical protein
MTKEDKLFALYCAMQASSVHMTYESCLKRATHALEYFENNAPKEQEPVANHEGLSIMYKQEKARADEAEKLLIGVRAESKAHIDGCNQWMERCNDLEDANVDLHMRVKSLEAENDALRARPSALPEKLTHEQAEAWRLEYMKTEYDASRQESYRALLHVLGPAVAAPVKQRTYEEAWSAIELEYRTDGCCSKLDTARRLDAEEAAKKDGAEL